MSQAGIGRYYAELLVDPLSLPQPQGPQVLLLSSPKLAAVEESMSDSHPQLVTVAYIFPQLFICLDDILPGHLFLGKQNGIASV